MATIFDKFMVVVFWALNAAPLVFTLLTFAFASICWLYH